MAEVRYREGYYAAAVGGRIYLDLDAGWPWLLLTGAAAILLEWFLARREKRWPGLLAPAAALAGAAVRAYLFYAENTPSGVALGGALAMLALYGVPALVLLAVYAACREGRRRKLRREREKMNVDDI